MFIRTRLAFALVGLIAPSAWAGPVNSDDATTLAPVLVTVQKRPEIARDVPLSLTTFDAQALDRLRVQGINDVVRLVPNAFFSASSGVNSLSVRGVGGGGRNIGFDPRVGVYLDGVYVGQAQALTMPWVDLEQAVFLRGPQGHLFGRNSVAGAVVLTSAPPSDAFEGQVRLSAGNQGLAEGSAVVSGPLSETVSGRVTIGNEHRDGVIRNRYDGDDLGGLDRAGGRASIRWTPTDSWRIDAAVDAGHLRQNIAYGQPKTDFFGFPLIGEPLSKREVDINTNPFVDLRTNGASVTAQYTLANGSTLTSITAQRATRQKRSNDMDYSAADLVKLRYRDEFKQTSQEFRWASSDAAPVRAVVGLYAAREDADTERYVDLGEELSTRVPVSGYPIRLPFGAAFGVTPGLAKAASLGQLRTDTAALFGSVDWDVTDRWTLELGGRYTWERKDLAMQLDGSGAGALRIAVLPDEQRQRDDTDFSPRASVVFHLSPSLNAYATYATGFKSGGWNVDFLNRAQAAGDYGFAPETVNSYEVGLKGLVLNDRLSFDVSAFRAHYDDFQVFQLVTLGSGTSAFQLRNAARATSQGLEASAAYQVTRRLRVGGAVGFLDATFDQFLNGDATGRDLSGNKMPEAPRRTASLQLDYRMTAGSAGHLDWHVDHSYRDGWYTAATNTPGEWVGSSQLTNASVRFVPTSGRWDLLVWVRNLGDRDFVVARTRDFFGNDVEQYNTPRSIGVTGTWHF